MSPRTRKSKTRKKSRAEKEWDVVGLYFTFLFFLSLPLFFIGLFVHVHGKPLDELIPSLFGIQRPDFAIFWFLFIFFLPMVLASIVARSRAGIYPIIATAPPILFILFSLNRYDYLREFADTYIMGLNLPYEVRRALWWLFGYAVILGPLLLTAWIGVKISVYLYRKFELEEKSKNRKRRKSGGW